MPDETSQERQDEVIRGEFIKAFEKMEVHHLESFLTIVKTVLGERSLGIDEAKLLQVIRDQQTEHLEGSLALGEAELEKRRGRPTMWNHLDEED